MKTNVHFWSYLAYCSLEWEMYQTKIIEKIKTNIWCSINFFKNRALYEVMLKNIVEACRPQMTMWRMRNACRIPKATGAHTEYVILIAFPLQHLLRERASMSRYTFIACLVRVKYSVVASIVIINGGYCWLTSITRTSSPVSCPLAATDKLFYSPNLCLYRLIL
jgi:hypothetical protein